MSKLNASTIAIIQKKVEKLLGEGEELRQMRLDVRESAKIRALIVREPFD